MPECQNIPSRVALGIFCATGVMTIYMSRVNLSVAIVAMATPKRGQVIFTLDNGTSEDSASTITPEPFCQRGVNGLINPSLDNVSITDNNEQDNTLNSTDLDNLDKQNDPEDTIELTGTQKGLVLGAFFYGYVLTSILGGRLAECYGTKLVFGIGTLIGGLLSFLTPAAARTDYRVFIALRILAGMGQGVCYPSLHALQKYWIPPNERSRFMSFVYVANCIGIIVTLSVSGVVIESIGWPWVFYITGMVTLLWLLFWWWLMYDLPSKHPRISQNERHYIERAVNVNTQVKPKSVPWVAILKSVPMWAVSIAHSGNLFGFSLLITQLPNYMSSILGFSIKENAGLSSLPFLFRFLGSNTMAWLSDWLLVNNKLSRRTSRRLFLSIGLLFPGTIMVILSYIGCRPGIAVALFALATFFNGAIVPGYSSNHLDLASNFGGTLMGVSNTLGFIFATSAPIIVGAITVEETIGEWQIVFWITFGVYLSGALLFFFFCSTDTEPWNDEGYGRQKYEQGNTEEQEQM